MKKQFKIIVLLLLLPATLLAEIPTKGKFTQQKNVRKAYLVNSDAGIDITNSYGNIYVTTWNEDKVELDVLITVSSDSEDWAIKRLNDISIDINPLKSMVSATTTIVNSRNNSGRNNSIEISYTIKIPKNGSVKLLNKYGDIVTADLYNSATISCKYGNISLGKLNSSKNTLNIDYVKRADIEFIREAQINTKYSTIAIGNFEGINMNSGYSNLSSNNGDNLSFSGNYGTLKLGSIGTLQVDGNYLNIKIEQLNKQLSVNTNYSQLKVLNVAPNCNDILINSGYTQISIGYNSGYNFDFNVSVRYGDFKYDPNFQVNKSHEASYTKSYQGFSGKSGVNNISVISNYGNVAITRNN